MKRRPGSIKSKSSTLIFDESRNSANKETLDLTSNNLYCIPQELKLSGVGKLILDDNRIK